ncbi:hypothetical protein [Chamaesiphon minutus]|nr:hypothetical protein [Chamaesiphon minutus]
MAAALPISVPTIENASGTAVVVEGEILPTPEIVFVKEPKEDD